MSRCRSGRRLLRFRDHARFGNQRLPDLRHEFVTHHFVADVDRRRKAAGVGAAYAYARPRRVDLVVEDELRTVRTRAGAVQPIYDKAGNQVARLKTTLFGHELVDLREGAQVRLGR